MDNEHKELLSKFFVETFSVFKETKEYISLIEEFDGEDRKVPAHTINELRGVLFHLYDIFETNETTHNMIEAKEHLYRACYDSYAIFCA